MRWSRPRRRLVCLPIRSRACSTSWTKTSGPLPTRTTSCGSRSLLAIWPMKPRCSPSVVPVRSVRPGNRSETCSVSPVLALTLGSRGGCDRAEVPALATDRVCTAPGLSHGAQTSGTRCASPCRQSGAGVGASPATSRRAVPLVPVLVVACSPARSWVSGRRCRCRPPVGKAGVGGEPDAKRRRPPAPARPRKSERSASGCPDDRRARAAVVRAVCHDQFEVSARPESPGPRRDRSSTPFPTTEMHSK